MSLTFLLLPLRLNHFLSLDSGKNVDEATEHARAARRKRWWCFFICVLIIIAIVLAIAIPLALKNA